MASQLPLDEPQQRKVGASRFCKYISGEGAKPCAPTAPNQQNWDAPRKVSCREIAIA